MAYGGLALCILITACVWLACRYENSQAAERPVHSSIIALSCAGLSLLLSSRFLTNRASARGEQSYEAIPLHDLALSRSSRHSSPIPKELPLPTLSSRKRRLSFVLLTACIALRVETFRRIVHNASCTHRGVATLLPVCLAVYDLITIQRYKSPPPKDAKYDTISNSIFDDMRDAYINSSLRYLPPTTALSWAAHFTTNSALRSTYICPIIQREQFPVPLIQYSGIFLDVVVIGLSVRLLTDGNRRRSRRSQSAYGLLFAAIILFLGLLCYVLPDVQARKSWAVDLSWTYISSALSFAITFSLIVHLLLYLAPAIRPLSLSVILAFACVYVPEVFRAFESRSAFPAQSNGSKFFAALLAFVSFLWFLSLEDVAESSKSLACVSQYMPSFFKSVAGLLFLLIGTFYLVRNNSVGFHPVDLLMYNARLSSESWMEKASSIKSRSLKGVVEEYRARYGKPPPPNFDKWYDFAKQRQSIIIDDYDQIHKDLLPYWALRPAEIRAQTTRILMNPWNELAGICIRNGNATVSPHIAPATHRWMADGVALMINNNMSQWLPDMDLAFNLFDEPRVAVPFQELQKYRKIGHDGKVRYKKGADRSFSAGAGSLWSSEWMNANVRLQDLGPAESPFQLDSFSQTFHRYGTRGCSPKSSAFHSGNWNPSEHCASCAAPHSIGLFMSNWTLSADVCHQPDMANLHGFYLAPAAFKVTSTLLPVFSQSRVHGYNDILYPSAWNYLENSTYEEEKDMKFTAKESSLFWRGLTSEGFSSNGEWRGMERQRFVHLANKLTNSTLVPMLINDNKLAYQNMPARELKGLLHFNVSFVDLAVRCGARDCDEQDTEFNITQGKRIGFQEHWKYKYLIDLDGAAFSGRFLPFLRSHSLPFKAGIFREWYDDRIIPWLHFVPLDTRLHGLYATLAYFAGLGDGNFGFERVDGELIQMEGRQDQAEWIAEQGRKWSQKVLRKEDMEIYFFRLLLEWGRLVDDRRDEIGFWLDE